MATFRKRGDRWQIQIRRKGLAAQVRTFQSRQDAERWGRAIERQMDLGEFAEHSARFSELHLRDLIRRYIAEVVSRKRSHHFETVILEAFLRHPLSNKKVSALTPSDFAAYKTERLKLIKPSSLRRQLNPLQNMFEVARRDWGLPMKCNPLAELRFAESSAHRERRLLPAEEDRILNAAAGCKAPYMGWIIVLAVETGLRRAELLNLRWEHVDLTNRSVLVSDPKNGCPRHVPLSQKAGGLFLNMPRTSALVFPISANAFRLSWERLRKRAGVVDLRFHDLRHEAVSRLFELGLTAPEVQSVSGHKDARMLFRYAHPMRTRVLQIMDRQNKLPPREQ